MLNKLGCRASACFISVAKVLKNSNPSLGSIGSSSFLKVKGASWPNCPLLGLHLGESRWKDDGRRSRALVLKKIDDGTEGEVSFDVDSSLRSLSDLFPDENSNNKLYDGVRFDELPIVNIKATKNNTIITLSDARGRVELTRSCGVEGFKNAKKGTNVAAQATAISFSMKSLEKGIKNVRVRVKGLGPGRLKTNRDDKSESEDEKSGSGSNEVDSDNNAGSVSGSNSEASSDSGTSSDSSNSGESGCESGSEHEVGEHNQSSSSAHSNSSNKERRPSKDGLKQYWEENPDVYGIRRSGRERKQPERMTVDHEQKEKLKQRRSHWHSSEASSDEESDKSDSKDHRLSVKKNLFHNKKEDLSERHKSKRVSRGTGNKVSYKEAESEGDDDEDLIEVDWKETQEDENVQTVEKILDNRMGKKGAVSMQTYRYEVAKNGDPNLINKDTETEMQFLVKWKNWSHFHNTWESEESLKTQKVKGWKKVENYLKREEELQFLRRRASPEELEYFEIQSELEVELFESHVRAERVFAEAVENSNKYYYVKWENLPYSEATWENSDLVQEWFPDKITEFEFRDKSVNTPRLVPPHKHRPKFSPLKLQPDYIGGSNEDLLLRDYQLNGVNWLIHAWCKHNSVILADEMGLGKTIQVIAFLSYLFHNHQIYGAFLLVIPLSTLNAWQREFEAWAPDMNVIVYLGDRDSRKLIRDYEFSFSSKRLKFNAMLTTYEILLRDKEELRDLCQWAALCIDEAHRLKNEESLLYQALMEFKSSHRILITGTPLQNSLKELWALLHFIMPEKFDDWEYFGSQHDEDNMKKGFHRLHRQLEPFLLRRVKKDVEKSLPAKVEQILRVDMTSQQKQYYKWILTKNYEMLKKGVKGAASTFVNIVMELKKCCNHAFLIKPLEDNAVSVELLQLLVRGSGKLLLLDKLLVRLNETGHRVLIFSQMVRMLDILGQYLQLRRFQFQRIDGSIKGEIRRQALDHFNAEGSSDFCFLLSTRAGGLGINLATADTVIIFDSDWNPQNDLQAQARAHRIGQKNQVNIYRLVTKNSIEETIIERAKQKMVLDHLVIQSMDTSGRTIFNKKMSTNSTPFNKEELNAILKFGAEELFKDEEDNDEEPVCDIDEILQRAEMRDEGPTSAGEELLSAFKMASFNLDEDEEVSKVEYAVDENTKDWDEIIPLQMREKIADEERQKEMADLYLPPRKRKTVNQTDDKPDDSVKVKKGKDESESGTDGEDSNDDKPRKRGRPRMHHRDTIKGFSDSEIRRFVKSFKKFSNPMRRLDTISVDADLREKPLNDLKKLGELLIEKCQDAMKEEASKDAKPQDGEGGLKRRYRGPSFKISSVNVNAKSMSSALKELEPLDSIVPHSTVERASWTLQLKRVKDAHWDIPWGIQDDSRLLSGVYEYGMGSWEQIKGDSTLNLGEKILVTDDSKPQGKHLESRVVYLLKLIRKQLGCVSNKRQVSKQRGKRGKESKSISKEIIENTDSSDDDDSKDAKKIKQQQQQQLLQHLEPKEEKASVKEEIKEEIEDKDKEKVKKKKKKKEKQTGPVHITANGEPVPVDLNCELDANHPLWTECKEKMRPMKKALKTLDNPNEGQTQEEQIQHTRRCLLQIGDHIDKCLEAYTNSDRRKEWKSLLWQFVSKFTEFHSKKLYKLYKNIKRSMEEKKVNEKKEKSTDKHSEKVQKRKTEEETSNYESPVKKPHNGWTERSAKWPEKPREHEREKAREKEKDKGDYSRGAHSSRRDWHHSPSGGRESRYPSDFKREPSSSYHRDSYNSRPGPYHRGGDWRGAQSSYHPKHPAGYGPPHLYPPYSGPHYSGHAPGMRIPHGPPPHPSYGSIPFHREWNAPTKDRQRPSQDWPKDSARIVANYPKKFSET